MFGQLFDLEGRTRETIKNTLEDVAEELGCNHSEFFIMIKPIDEKFEMKFYIYRLVNGKPALVREIELKEILGS
jgi:hypothetical protein